MRGRRQARATALKALYEIDLAGHDPEDVLRHRLEHGSLPDREAEFTRHLIEGIVGRQRQLDEVLREIAPEWPIEEIAAIDRSILRMAIFEMAIDRDTPRKVVINEAVELAKTFGSDGGRRFVNGALGTLVDQPHLLRRVVKENETE